MRIMETSEKSKLKTGKLLEYMKYLESPQGFLYASGSKFHRLFGRDSVITSLELLPWFPQYAKNTITTLIKHQRKNGQIIHETYKRKTMWDSLDSTPLFLILVTEYFFKTKDEKFIKKIIPKIEKAYNWIEIYGDNDDDNLLEYHKNSNGLAHHCWKDSYDGMTDETNSIPKYPIAPSETQGYYYKALINLSEMFKSLGEKEKANKFGAKAKTVKKIFNKCFWMKDKGFFAMALDGDENPIKLISSNIGHALWSGIVDDDKIDSTIKRILKKDIFTEFGLRTLSENMGNYNPFSYHKGSIWPFDNWFLAEALEKYGYTKEAKTVRKNILHALLMFGKPLECFSFHEGKLGVKLRTWDEKVLYPEKVQAWTVGAMYSFLMKP